MKLAEFADYIDKKVQKIDKELRKLSTDTLDVRIEGPELCFDEKKLRYAVDIMEYLSKGNRTEYKNFVGEARVMIEFYPAQAYEYDVGKKFDIAFKIAKVCQEGRFFKAENAPTPIILR